MTIYFPSALYNDIDRLKELISRGHTNNRDETGYTALHYAARKNNILACEILLKANANVNAETNGGVTPLQRAAMMGIEYIMYFSLKYFLEFSCLRIRSYRRSEAVAESSRGH